MLAAVFLTLLLISVYIQMSQFIVQCLNPYRKPDCKLGRISNTEDFKHLARKVRTIFVFVFFHEIIEMVAFPNIFSILNTVIEYQSKVYSLLISFE